MPYNLKTGLCFDDNMVSITTKTCILLQLEHLINAYKVTDSIILETLTSDEQVFISTTHLDRSQLRQNQTGKICFYLNLGCQESSFNNLNLKHGSW